MDNLSKTGLPKIENACFAVRSYHEIKLDIVSLSIFILTGIYIFGCVFAIVICLIIGVHTLLASRSNPKNKTTGLLHGTGAQLSVCIHMIAIESRL